MIDLIIILASVTTVSLIAFIGLIFAGMREERLNRITMLLVGFASGTLIGGSFLHLLPEALASGNDATTVFFYVIAGIIVFFALEKFFYWRHCHEKECPTHAFVYLNLIGDGIHNFIDGMIIAATYIVALASGSYHLGLATTVAVIFHEIPQELGDFGVLIYGGLSRKKALTFNFVSAVTAVAGALTTYFLAHARSIEVLLVPFAAGGFIYIAATDLMPELHKKSHAGESLIQFLIIILGIGLMAFLKMAFEH
ncbi:MAG: ZIP family metal transporter [Nitrososphaerota archaeon]|nr:ZIP family metal transporter [Candidatus Bathyarchaeota archaeon]MDW8023022.1 ZIP family metal transporter [Nitrososphaerota archaeon]